MEACCAPRGRGQAPALPNATGAGSSADEPVGVAAGDAPPAVAGTSLIRLPGGTFRMGGSDDDANLGDGEGPIRDVTLSPFLMSAHPVTNDQFARFVDQTGYRTGAERFGWSFVFAGFLPGPLRGAATRPASAPWWCRVDGATWNTPEGPGSDLGGRGDHPVVHVDHDDARAFCGWAGLRLPTEAEWEYAARGGLDRARFPWGDELTPAGEHRCNIWQGQFPVRNTAEDGFSGTCPVEAFPANRFGLHGTSGNVWEWCADWWTTDHPAGGMALRDPTGPSQGTSRVMRGGSYLCHHSYCNRYRVAARTRNDPDSCSGNVGFRCAADI